MRPTATGTIGLLFVVTFAVGVNAAEFRPVAAYRGANKLSGVGMSSDGRFVVGGTSSPSAGSVEAYKWSVSGGIQWLGFFWPPAADDGLPQSGAFAASSNGSMIVGSTYVNTYHVINFPVKEVKGFGVRSDSSYIGLPWLSGDDEAYPLDVTANGHYAVGMSYEVAPWLFGINYWAMAVGWTDGSVHELGTLGDDDDSFATAVSDNGSVIVGQSGHMSSNFYGSIQNWRPFVRVGGSNQALQRLTTSSCGSNPGSLSYSCDQATNLSGNGIRAVGHLFNGSGIVPVYWSTSTRQVSLLTLLPGDSTGKAHCASNDGSIIGGRSNGKAVLWDLSESNLPSRVDLLLANRGLGSAISGWQLTDVAEVSSDGSILAGIGVHPNGKTWVWWADLSTSQSNDNCQSARHIDLASYEPTQPRIVRGDTLGATLDGDTTCANPDGPDVWYSLTPPKDGYLYLDLCGSTTQQPLLSVHSGCPGTTSNQIYCTNSCSGQPCNDPCILPHNVSVTGGQTYYIRVARGAGLTAEGTFFSLQYEFLPDNDDCDDAVLVGLGVSDWPPGHTSQATTDHASMCFGVDNTAPGVWYKVIGTGTAMTASTCGNADFDTKISVYCGGCGETLCIGANDDACATASEVSWCSESGQVYHVLVHGYQSAVGAFWLDISHDGTACQGAIDCSPANENCAGAISMTPGVQIMDNTGADTSAIAASCAVSNHDMWYSYTTRCDGEFVVDTCFWLNEGSLADTVLSVYDACGGLELQCSDDYQDASVNCGQRSAIVRPSPPGQRYLIRVADFGGAGQEDQGTFPLHIVEVPSPMSLGGGGALPDARQDQTYHHQLQMSGGCPPFMSGTTPMYFMSASGLPLGMTLDWSGVISGTPTISGVYEVEVRMGDSDLTTPGDIAYFSLVVLPSNDACPDAIPVGEEVIDFGTVGASTDGPDEPGACENLGHTTVDSDVWYCYTSACNGIATASLCGSTYDTKVAVYEGCVCPTSESAIVCNDDDCGTQSHLAFGVQDGLTYLVRVGGYSGSEGNGQLVLSCFDDCNENWVDDLEEIASGATTDCNSNYSPDDCERKGDFSGDGSLSLGDYAYVVDCMTDPCPVPGCNPAIYPLPCCFLDDFDDDGDVDLRDVQTFAQAFGTPGR